MPNINVEEIMSDIRKDIQAKGLEGYEPFGFKSGVKKNDLDEEAFTEALALLKEKTAIPLDRPLSGGGLKLFFKRMVRKCTRFYLKPVIDDQEQFNQKTYDTIEQMSVYVLGNKSAQELKMDELSKRIDVLMVTANKLENRLNSMEK